MLATLEIDFNCMCVFVPQERAPGVGTVYVLMPDTTEHTHPSGHHRGPTPVVERHVVRMYHRKVEDALGVDVAGWALELGEGMADTTLVPMLPEALPADAVNLSRVAKRGVPPTVLDTPSPLAGRFKLGVGACRTTKAEAFWWMAGQRMRMAHRLVWRIEGLVLEDELRWIPLRGQTDGPPLRTLKEVGPDRDEVYRISIYHVPEKTLPPDPFGVGQLNEATVQAHFRALYTLLGIHDPGTELLPQLEPSGGGKVDCLIATAEFE